MGVIAFSDGAAWKVARHEFQLVLARAARHTESDADRGALEQAAALDGLHLDLLDNVQIGRLTSALRESVDELIRDHAANSEDERERRFIERLAELRQLLEP